MPEYIERYDAEEYFKKNKQTMWHKDDVVATISSKSNIPAADVVEVVRCEKCRYFFDDCCNHPKNRVAHKVPDFGKHYVYVAGMKVEPNHFCGYGERGKTND